MPETPDFGSFGCCVEIRVEQMPAAMKEAYDFTLKLRGQVYVTGALVHVGRGLAKAIRAQEPWSTATPYFLLWIGLVLGAATGTLVTGRPEASALAFAAGVAVVLSLLVALSLVGKRPVPTEAN